MMLDIFSSFDPHIYSMSMKFSFAFWTFSLFIIFLIVQTFWSAPNPNNYFMLNLKSIMIEQTGRTMGSSMKGFSSFIPIMFVMIILLNFMGLLPYIFSTTSHLIITLSIGIPMWMSLVLSSFVYDTWTASAQLLPGGAPNWLNPFLVIVETLSMLVRPITLSFRLAANMTAGHVVLGLVGSYLSSSLVNSCFSVSSFSTMLVATGYIMFEMGICLIQSYIFCLLLTLYSDDHS